MPRKTNHSEKPEAAPDRDARGRWRKGHCPNPKGRPKKRRQVYRSQADLMNWKNTHMPVVENGETKWMSRQEIVLNAMLQHAMKGRVSVLKYLHQIMREEDVNFAKILVEHERLIGEQIAASRIPGQEGRDRERYLDYRLKTGQQAIEYYLGPMNTEDD